MPTTTATTSAGSCRDSGRRSDSWWWRRLAAAVLLLTPCFFQPAAAQETPAFRSGVDLVRLRVTVLDDQRRPVTGLTADDFTILDEGDPVGITSFAAVSLPVVVHDPTSAAWTREVAPDVADNLSSRDVDGRLVAIVMDRSIPTGAPIIQARKVAHALVDALGPGDRAAVVHTSEFANEGSFQGFTSDRARLRAAIDATFPGATREPSAGPSMPGGGCQCGLCSLQAIESAARAMGEVEDRQKLVLFIGTTIAIDDRSGPIAGAYRACSGRANEPRDRLMRALDRANVTVHSIEPSGLETFAAQAEDRRGRRRTQNPLTRQGDLAVLPDFTGGRIVASANAPESSVAALLRESSSYYLLAFERPISRRGPAFRELEVRVARRNVTVLARHGYYTDSEALAEARAERPAIGGLLPRTDIRLRMQLATRFAPSGVPAAGVLLEIPAGAFGKSGAASLQTMTLIFDASGRPVSFAESTLPPEAPPQVTPLTTQSWLPLEPGRYEIRVGLEAADPERVGSVYGYLDVPEPSADSATLSVPLIVQMDSGNPVLRRDFSDTERLHLTVQAIAPDSAPLWNPIRVTIVDATGALVADTRVEREPPALGRVAEYEFPIPLNALAAGEYLLRIHAPNGSQRAHVRFTVRGGE